MVRLVVEVIVKGVLKIRLFKRCGSMPNREGGQPDQAGGRKIRRNYRHRHNPLTYVNLGVVGPLISGSSIPGVLVSEGFVNGYPLKNHITQD